MGFAQLADLIAQDPDHETYLFRSFSKLAVRTALQMQSELALLEKEQGRLDNEAAKLTSDRRLQMMSTKWQSVEELDADAKVDQNIVKRIELADKIATKLSRYYEFLELQARVAKHNRPSKRVLKAYRSFFYGEDGKTPQLYEPSSAVALHSDEHDHVAIYPPKDEDILTKYLRDHFPAPSIVGVPMIVV